MEETPGGKGLNENQRMLISLVFIFLRIFRYRSTIAFVPIKVPKYYPVCYKRYSGNTTTIPIDVIVNLKYLFYKK
jgi:hypothetical protein